MIRFPRVNKYGNTKTIIDGIRFDSKREAHRYVELKLLKRAGKIKDLLLQAPFLLQKEFIYEGKKERPILYLADFWYVENGRQVIEDVKGMRTDVYKIKRKMLLYRYPEILFREL